MSILATAPSGGRRKGPGGRWEVYASGKGWVPEESLSLDELAKLQEAPRAPQVAQEPRQESRAGKEPSAEPERRTRGKAVQVRIDGKWIAESCVQVWEAYGRLRSVSAVARELGMGQGNVSNRLQRYEAVFGVERPQSKPAKPTSSHYDPPKPKPAEPVSEPAADHASVLHPPVDENVEPVDASDVLSEMFGSQHPAVAALAAEDEVEEEWYEAWLKDRRADAAQAAEVHRGGYARGYAVATLRALAAMDGLPEQLRDMATDAADGLMA